MVVMVVVRWVGMAGTGAGAGVDGAEEVNGSLGSRWSYSDGSHWFVFPLRWSQWVGY